MPSCCQRPRTRSSGATGVTGRCRRRLTVCGRRGRCKGGWLWISKATNRRTAATISCRPSTTLGNDSDQPTFFATVSFLLPFLLSGLAALCVVLLRATSHPLPDGTQLLPQPKRRLKHHLRERTRSRTGD